MGANASKQAKQKATAKIPLGDTPQDRGRRGVLFAQFDMNGNGYLSLAQIDKGVRDVLGIPQLFDSKPVIMRAYQAALKKTTKPSPFSQDYVTKSTFKYLMIYLRFYYELWEDFEKIDVNDERRLSQNEFKNGAKLLTEEWKIKIDDPDATFKQILTKYNAVEHITFTDFCDYVISERLKQHPNAQNHDQL